MPLSQGAREWIHPMPENPRRRTSPQIRLCLPCQRTCAEVLRGKYCPQGSRAGRVHKTWIEPTPTCQMTCSTLPSAKTTRAFTLGAQLATGKPGTGRPGPKPSTQQLSSQFRTAPGTAPIEYRSILDANLHNPTKPSAHHWKTLNEP